MEQIHVQSNTGKTNITANVIHLLRQYTVYQSCVNVFMPFNFTVPIVLPEPDCLFFNNSFS